MRKFIEIFYKRFENLHLRSIEIIERTPPEELFRQPREISKSFPFNSVGENILRSAGAVEQAFGGIMTRLWDDPFEWTLPETLATNELILDYLEEVEKTRRGGFELFLADEDLGKEIPAPQTLKTLFEILIETLAGAENLQGRAVSIFQIISVQKSAVE